VENISLYKGDTIDPKSYAKIVDFFKQSTDARMRLTKLCTRFFVSKF